MDPYETDPTMSLLQTMRGTDFHRVAFVAREFLTPFAACEACARRILERPEGPEADGGFVRLVEVQTSADSLWLQWQWLCEGCFAKYRERADLQVAPGPIPQSTLKRYREYRREGREQWERENPLRDEDFSVASVLRAEEVAWIASGMGVDLTKREAAELLWRNRDRLQCAMDAIAFELIQRILRSRGGTR